MTTIEKGAGGFNTAIGTVDNVVRAANGLLCAASVLFTFTDPTILLKGIGLFAANIANTAGNLIADAIQYRVDSLLGQISLPIRLLQSYIKSLTGILDSLTKKSLDLRIFMTETQNCAVQAANFLNCIAQSVANQISKKVIANIDKEFDTIQSNVSKSIYSKDGLLSQHTQRNIRAAEKIANQITIMR